MKTLDEHNNEVFSTQIEHRTGVSCPKCADSSRPEYHEMRFLNPSVVNASYPPSRTVVCPVCGHVGYMR